MTSWLVRVSAAAVSADKRQIERIETTPAGVAADGNVVDLTQVATFSESEVVSVEAGYVRVKQDGTDTIDIRIGDMHVQLPVTSRSQRASIAVFESQ